MGQSCVDWIINRPQKRFKMLHKQEIETKAVYEMQATTRPRYLVITSSAITLEYLIQTVKHLMSVKVTFIIR